MLSLPTQRAQWDIRLPRGKNCRGTIFAPVLPLNRDNFSSSNSIFSQVKIAGVLRSKDGFLHFALRFPIFQAFFVTFFIKKSDGFFFKPPVLQNRGPPKTKTCTPLWFFNGAQNLWLYLFLKHMSENGQKRSPVKTREMFLMSWNALKRSVLRPLSKT